ncbi:MAG TPA: hypothetical protein VD971_06055 [Phycisphaerales bacterium]|nr:hypothetical protein [Phycisphaerales bacterium]
MNRNDSRQRWRALCASLGPDDGVNPKDDRKAASRDAAHGWKDKQLCVHAARALGAEIARLRSVEQLGVALVAVEAPDGPVRLRVVCAFDPRRADEAAAIAALNAAKGMLRASIARAIVRKRVPDIAFSLIPADVLGGLEETP